MLSLTGTQVSNIEPLKNLTSLEELHFDGRNVSVEQEAELLEALPKLNTYH